MTPSRCGRWPTRAGVTPAAIYRHFTDRNELIFEACERRFRELDHVVERAAASSRDPLESLRRRGRAYVRFGLAHPEEYRIWFMSKPGATPGWTADRIMEGPVVTHLVQAVQACLDAGVIRPADPTLVAFGLWSAVHGLTSLLITKPAFPWPDLDERPRASGPIQTTGAKSGRPRAAQSLRRAARQRLSQSTPANWWYLLGTRNSAPIVGSEPFDGVKFLVDFREGGAAVV